MLTHPSTPCNSQCGSNGQRISVGWNTQRPSLRTQLPRGGVLWDSPVFQFRNALRMDRGRVGVWNKATTAAGFVHSSGADGDALFGFEDALGVVGGLATLHADGVSLCNVLGDGEELPHRFPGVARVVLIQSGDYYSHSLSKLVAISTSSLSKNCPSSMPTTFLYRLLAKTVKTLTLSISILVSTDIPLDYRDKGIESLISASLCFSQSRDFHF